MVARTWIGGGRNSASDPDNWSPQGAPEPLDTLQILGPGRFAMKVRGDDLAGDPLQISGADATLDLSRHADVTARVLDGSTATFNLSGVNHLDLSVFDLFGASSATVNLAELSVWVGSFHINNGTELATHQKGWSAFVHDGQSGVDDFASAVLAMPVVGTGDISVSGNRATLEFESYVGPGLHIHASGSPGTSKVIVEQPRMFFAETSLGFAGEIDLMGLAQADSYSYANDMLAIYSGDHVINTLRLDSVLPYGLAVVKTDASVNVVSLSSPDQVLADALPVHSDAGAVAMTMN